jgi:ribosomal protein S6
MRYLICRQSAAGRQIVKGMNLAERFYECMFLLDSGRYAQDPQGTEDAVKEFLTRCNAELVALAPWQEGKLPYEIDGHRKGLHLLTYFKMDGSQVEAGLFELMTSQLAHGGAQREEEPAAAE